MSIEAAAQPRISHRRLKIVGIIAVCIAVAVVVAGVLLRFQQNRALVRWTDTTAVPTVAVFQPVPITGDRRLVLPGTLEAYYSAPIFARVPGYLKMWYQDIGAHVKAGQLLAVIDTPELDEELDQAKADLASAKAAQNLAAITARRWSSLLKKDAVSAQETDEKLGDLATLSAKANAAQANVDRLQALSAFKRITAPFAGVVTARKTDIGDLINAGAGATNASELFDVSEIDKLRLYVRAPQAYSAEIKPGVTAYITVPQYPDRKFPAKLLTTSNSVSDASGTLLVELLVPNKKAMLDTGDYAQVTFDLPAATAANQFSVPDSAVMFRTEGTEVGTVTANGTVRMVQVGLGNDNGQSVEVLTGLVPSDRIIDNPAASIATGDKVRAVAEDDASGSANAGD